jgi:hypothetical protein
LFTKTNNVELMKLHYTMLACTLAVAGLTSYPSHTNAMTPADINDISIQIQNVSEAIARFAQTPEGQVLGWAGTRGTSTAQAPVIATCRIKTDKWVYKVGETVKVSWSAENAQSGSVQAAAKSSEEATLATISSTQKNGTASWRPTTPGLVTLTNQVQSSTGFERTCVQTISVVPATANLKESRYAGLTAGIAKKSMEMVKVDSAMKSLEAKQVKLVAEMGALMKRLTELESGSTPHSSSTTSNPILSFVTSTEEIVKNSSPIADDKGVYELTMEVTARDGDVYIPQQITRAGSGVTTSGFVYVMIDAATKRATASGIASAIVSSKADTVGTNFIVSEGETETFTVRIDFNPGFTGAYKASMYGFNWSATPGATLKNKGFSGTFASDALVYN